MKSYEFGLVCFGIFIMFRDIMIYNFWPAASTPWATRGLLRAHKSRCFELSLTSLKLEVHLFFICLQKDSKHTNFWLRPPCNQSYHSRLHVFWKLDLQNQQIFFLKGHTNSTQAELDIRSNPFPPTYSKGKIPSLLTVKVLLLFFNP